MNITHLCPVRHMSIWYRCGMNEEEEEEIYVDSIPNRTLFLDFLEEKKRMKRKNFIHIYNGRG